MTTPSARLRESWATRLAGTIAFGMDVVYLFVLRSEGEGDLQRARPQLIAASIAASAAAAFVSPLLREPRLRLALLAAAAFTLLAWGFVGMFTIGLPVFAGGVLLLVPASRAADELSTAEGWTITGASAVSAAVLAGAVVAATG